MPKITMKAACPKCNKKVAVQEKGELLAVHRHKRKVCTGSGTDARALRKYQRCSFFCRRDIEVLEGAIVQHSLAADGMGPRCVGSGWRVVSRPR